MFENMYLCCSHTNICFQTGIAKYSMFFSRHMFWGKVAISHRFPYLVLELSYLSQLSRYSHITTMWRENNILYMVMYVRKHMSMLQPHRHMFSNIFYHIWYVFLTPHFRGNGSYQSPLSVSGLRIAISGLVIEKFTKY